MLGFIAFYIPQGYSVSAIVMTLWKYSILIISVFSGLSMIKLSLVSKRYMSVALYYFWLFIGTHFFSTHGQLLIYNFISCAGFFAYLEVLLNTKSLKSVMRAYILAGGIMFVVHFISFIYLETSGDIYLYGTVSHYGGHSLGLQNNNRYFLSFDNISYYYFVSVIVLLFYYSCFYSRNALKHFLTYCACVLFMFFYKMTATCLAASLFLIFSLLYFYSLRKHKNMIPTLFFSYKSSIIIGLLSDVLPLLIVGSKFILGFESLFGKDITFTGRDKIWTTSFLYIMRNPIAGRGIEDMSKTGWIFGVPGLGHCHNIIVENLFRGGIIAIILMLVMIWQYRPRKADKFKTAIFAAGMISYFVTASMDWRYNTLLPWAIMIFNYYANKEAQHIIHDKK